MRMRWMILVRRGIEIDLTIFSWCFGLCVSACECEYVCVSVYVCDEAGIHVCVCLDVSGVFVLFRRHLSIARMHTASDKHCGQYQRRKTE